MDECKPLFGGVLINAAVFLLFGRVLHSSTFQLILSRFGHTSPCAPV